jgi:transcriptional regulator with XRE-family HTH domain
VATSSQLQYVTPIERYRLDAGLSQQEAAQRAGVKVRTLRRAEYGETAPSFATITALARLFEIEPSVLLDETRQFYGARRPAA